MFEPGTRMSHTQGTELFGMGQQALIILIYLLPHKIL